MTYVVPNHNGCNFRREATDWPVYDGERYVGQINMIESSAVPDAIKMALWGRTDIECYLSSQGHWATSAKEAQALLLSGDAPAQFLLLGPALSLFVPPQWFVDNGQPSPYQVYQVSRHRGGWWDATEVNDSPAPIPAAQPVAVKVVSLPFEAEQKLRKQLKQALPPAKIEEPTTAIADYVGRIGGLYRFCHKTATDSLAGTDLGLPEVKDVATSLFIQTVRHFNL